MSDVEAIQSQDRMRPVYIGGRFMGEIAESEWHFIVDGVRSNRRIWQAQAMNVLRVASRTLGFGFISVPLGIFWTAATLGWLGKPVAFPGPGEHIGALLGHPDIVAAGIALAVAAMLAIGLKLGFVNYFAKAQSALVKAHLGLDEPGECSVR
ncbi:MAG: hypothetical protein ACHQAZ_07660 [Gammaproteobacteria bacterium]|jgi:hypothetical protein|nr:hypothetical protein [Gammaproteobacteria bacterium]